MQYCTSFIVYTRRRESGLHEANPYLSPLLDTPTVPSAAQGAMMGYTCTDKSKGQNKKEAVASLLSDMSMADAVQCITQFLRCDKRCGRHACISSLFEFTLCRHFQESQQA